MGEPHLLRKNLGTSGQVASHADEKILNVRNLSCVLLNARSLYSNLQDFRFFLASLEFDLVFVTESWLSELHPDSLIVGNLPYFVVRRDRGSRGGGLLIAIRHGTHFKLSHSGSDTESMSLDLVKEKIRIFLGYIPDKYDKTDVLKMCSEFRSVVNTGSRNLILGDFNMSFINWDALSASHENGWLFLDCVSELGMSQLVTEPTREENTLDLVLADDDRLVYGVTILEHLGLSDHCMVAFNLQGHNSASGRDPCFGSGKIDFTKLRPLLGRVNWSFELLNCTNVNMMFEQFISILKDKINLCHVPTTCKNKIIAPRNISKLRLKKKKLWQKFKSNRTAENRLLYNSCKHNYSKLVREFEITQEKLVIERGNMADLYRFVGSKLGGHRSIPPLVVNADFVVAASDKANIFINEFSKNFVIDNNHIPSLQFSTDLSCCETPNFTADSILRSISAMKSSRSVGPDGFSSYFIKEVQNEICTPLSWICEKSMESGQLPDLWKTARISPIFKKGEASNPGNYRPVAQTSVFCKVMERIIRTTMTAFVEQHNLLADDQFGFRPRLSTCLQLLSVLEDWTASVDSGIPVDVIYIDFAKAFDSVTHVKLLAKLDVLGFRGHIHKWLSGFLLNRTQWVQISGECSELVKVISGVPQGSVLGPLLFVLYINDLKSETDHVTLKKFADDVKESAQVFDDDSYHSLLRSLIKLQSWADLWQLPVAPDKCSVLHLGNLNEHREYSLVSDRQLPVVEPFKDLGVWFRHDLKFSSHCNIIVNTARKRAGIIRKFFKSGDPVTLVWAFKVYVRPILEYASPVWSPYLLRDIDLIESVQRRFTKALRGCRDQSYSSRLQLLGLESLELRRLRADLCLTYSLLRGIVRVDYTKFFELRMDKRTRGHSWKLVVQSSKLNCRKHFFSNRIVNCWNSLPALVVQAPSLGSFKARLRSCSLKTFLLRY